MVFLGGMDSEFISNLCASLSLEDEGIPAATIADGQRPLEEAKLGLCLVRKIFCSRSVNREAFWNPILGAWNT